MRSGSTSTVASGPDSPGEPPASAGADRAPPRRTRPSSNLAAASCGQVNGTSGGAVPALAEQCGELLRREDPVALGHELTDLRPVGVVGEQHTDAIAARSRSEVRVTGRQQRVAFAGAGPQHEQPA